MRELVTKWSDSKDPRLQCTGWNTWSGLVAILGDEELDLDEIRK